MLREVKYKVRGMYLFLRVELIIIQYLIISHNHLYYHREKEKYKYYITTIYLIYI